MTQHHFSITFPCFVWQTNNHTQCMHEINAQAWNI